MWHFWSGYMALDREKKQYMYLKKYIKKVHVQSL